MIVGIIGVGVVGGALKKWFEENTTHHVRSRDIGRGLDESFDEADAIFICIPVPPAVGGQDTTGLASAIESAKKYTQNIYIRSTVLPGTCDKYGVTSFPEFLTERRANDDMTKLPLLVGNCDREQFQRLFPGKEVTFLSNVEAEIAKYAHNCFGAMKVTYFNFIYQLSKNLGADYENVRNATLMTGYINKEHTQVPGPDGKFGYGGKCFPENMLSLRKFLHKDTLERGLLGHLEIMNQAYRGGA